MISGGSNRTSTHHQALTQQLIARVLCCHITGLQVKDCVRRALVSRAAGASAPQSVFEFIESSGVVQLQREAVLQGAAVAGRLDMLSWLVTCSEPYHYCKLPARAAAKHGHLHILKWIHKESGGWSAGDGISWNAA